MKYMAWNRFHLTILLVGSLQSLVVGEPSFVERPESVEQALGTTVLLRCTIANLTQGANFVTWARLLPTPKQLFVLSSPHQDVPDRYSVVSPSNDEFHLEMRDLQPEDTGEYECAVTRSTLTAVASVTALALPGSPEISQNKTSDLREGDYVEFVCASSGGHPTPDITWFRNGLPVPNMQFISSEKPYGDSRSIAVIRLSRSDHQRSVECRVSNKVNAQNPLVAQRNLTVKYRPALTITPKSPHRVLEGESEVSLQCGVDANPPESQIMWFGRGVPLASTGGVVRLNSIQVSDAGAYTCQAVNQLGSTNATLQLQVLYQPKVSLPAEVVVNESFPFTVECSVDAQPDPDEITWRWDDSPLPLTQQDASLSADRRVITFSRASRQMTGKLVCEARNTLRLSDSGDVRRGSGNDVTNVIVNYAPGAASISDVNHVFVGSNVVLTCQLADQGVPVAQFQWFQGETPLSAGAELIITSVTLQHEGVYTCRGFNLAGSGPSASRTLVVNEYPKWETPLLDSESTVRIGRQRQIVLTCAAKAKPQPNIRWRKDGMLIDAADRRYYRIDNTQSALPAGNFRVKSLLTFTGTERESGALRVEDRGLYTCEVYHERNVYSSKSQNQTLIVQFAPQVAAANDRISAAMNSTVTLNCTALANPRPTFRWFGPGGTPLLDGTDIRITGQVTGQDRYSSQLRLDRLKLSSKGTYTCRANNSAGQGHDTIQLAGIERPETPTGLRLATEKPEHVTWESMALTWQPGFSGGLSQRFAIELKSGDEERTVNVPHGVGNTYNVTGLMYSTTYQFRIQAVNDVGASELSPPYEARTEDFSLPSLSSVSWDEKSKEVRFQLDYSGMCVRVEVHDSGSWKQAGECYVPTLGTPEKVKVSTGSDVRAKLCLIRRNDVCGPTTSAQKVEEDIPQSTLIAIVVVCALVVIALVVVLVLLCLRKRRIERKLQYKKQEAARPKPMSAPPPIISNPQSFDNPAMERADSVDMDDPTTGGIYASGYDTDRVTEPPSYTDWAKHSNSMNMSYNTEAYEMENQTNALDEDEKKDLHLSSGYDPYSLSLRESPRSVSLMRHPSDSSRYSSDPTRAEITPFYSQKTDSSRSAESGYSSAPDKPKKVIYEVVV